MKLSMKILILVFGVIFFFAPNLKGYEDLRFETWANNLGNENVLIRKSAAKHLGTLGEKRAIPYLLKAIKDDHAQVRAEICKTLGLLGDESVIERLKRIAYKDPSPKVRSSARKAIENIETYSARQKEKKLKAMKDQLKAQEN